MLQRFEITHVETNAKISVSCDSRDALVWERTNKRGRDVVDLANGSTMADQYDLAWHAAKREGKLDGVERKVYDAEYLVEAIGASDDVDPTE